MKTACVTGHRPDKLPWGKNLASAERKEFLERLKEYIIFCYGEGITRFISGAALGVDLDFAETVLSLKKDGYDIFLEMAIPCCGQEKYWQSNDKKRYISVLNEADEVTVLCRRYTPFCMQYRNRYMVDKSDAVICCWNGDRKGGTFSTIKYAQTKRKKLLHLDLRKNAFNGGNSFILFLDNLI